MKQGVKIGDVLEVRTSRGLAYVQYTHYQKPLGALIRVLPGFHQSRPTDWAQLAKTKELYFVFCPIETLVDRGLLLVASNEQRRLTGSFTSAQTQDILGTIRG